MVDAGIEPPLEARSALSRGIGGDVSLVLPQPLDDARVGDRLCGLAQNVGVDQISHSASVDSDSIGTKNPFSGQARSQSTTLSFGERVRRTSRYGSMRSCFRS